MDVPTQHWSVADVFKYISNLEIDGFKYNEFAPMFRQEIINGRVLLNLEKDDLNVLGLHQFAKRNALYKHIQKLKAKQQTKQSFNSSPTIRNNKPITVLETMTNTKPFAKESPPPKPFTSFNYGTNQFSPQNISYNNNNTMNNMNNIMTPLILPSPSPLMTPINTNTIKVLNNNNQINRLSNTSNISNNMPPINTNIQNLISTFNSNSPIYNSSFPQIHSPLLTNTNYKYNVNTSPILINNIPNNNNKINNNNNISNNNNRNLLLNDYNQNNEMKIANNEINETKNEIVKINTSIQINSTSTNESELAQIVAIYQGVNSHNTVFTLMTQENIMQLNDLYKRYNVLSDNSIVKSRNIFSPLQKFKCNIETKKIQHGWQINKNNIFRLPFNPLIKFKVNIFTDEIVLISPAKVKGHINHINSFGQAWITSDLQIDAIEEITVPSALISNIITLKLTNISHTSLQQRNASYMIHDPEHINDYKWKKGMKIKFCLKLSTRTNKKNKNTQKPVFVQAWNVAPL